MSRAAKRAALERDANRAYLRSKLIVTVAASERASDNPASRALFVIGALVAESRLPEHEVSRIQGLLCPVGVSS